MHRNAPLTPEGRLRLCQRIDDWLDRRRGGGVDEHLPPVRPQVVAPLPRRGRRRGSRIARADRTSCPHQTPARVERRIVALRQSRKLGPARLAGIVGVPASTVHRVLVRHGVNRLRWMDRPTGRVDPPHRDQPLRRAGPHRRQEARPGPRRRRPQACSAAAPRQRVAEAAAATPTSTPPSTPTPGSPTASSPASRTPTNCVAFLDRAVAWFAAQGITIERILTDNGNGYRSHAWRDRCAELGITTPAPGPTGPPPTARSNASTAPCSTNGPTPGSGPQNASRARALDRLLHRYNHHRHHTAIGGPPASRVTNLAGHNN